MMNNPTAALNVWLMVGTVILGLALLALAGWLTYRLISGTGRTGGNQTELDGLSRQLAAGDMSVDQYQTAVSTLAGSTASRAPRSTWTITALVAAATALVVGLGALFVGGAVVSQAMPIRAIATVGGLASGMGGGMGGSGMGGSSRTGGGMGMGSARTDTATALAACPTAVTTGAQAVFTADGMVMGSGMGHASLTPSQATVPAGKVTVTLVNAGGQPHELVVLPLAPGQQVGARTVGADDKVSETGALGEVHPVCPTAGDEGDTPAGGISQVTLDLPAGTYEVVCNLPGHYASGMYARLVVA